MSAINLVAMMVGYFFLLDMLIWGLACLVAVVTAERKAVQWSGSDLTSKQKAFALYLRSRRS